MEELNQEQLLAATHVDGPVLVFAGAGSGKTRTLTYRIINMIKNHHISENNILAITFTNKATNEMKERINKFLDIDTRKLNISTFHSLCARILRVDIGLLGYRKDFAILDEEDQQKFIGDIVKELNFAKANTKKYQKEINNNKCFDIPLDSFRDRELVKVALRYEEEMKDQNLLDFEDLLLKVYEIFVKFPSTLEKYQNKFKYILVDEFQDTNLIQYRILKLLAFKHRNLFVVGDDDQSIYSFRGTNYENISLFKEDFPEYASFTLSTNYRSSKTIIEYANRLIAHNINREKKKMVAFKDGQVDDVIYVNPGDEKEEARYIVKTIINTKGAIDNFSDFAVLYRSSALNRHVELEMIRMGVPYKIYGGISYLRRKEIKDVIAYFRLMINNDDVNSFKRIVNTPTRGIGEATLAKVLEIRRINKVNILEAIALSESIITRKRFEELEKIKDLIEKYSQRLQDENLLETFDSFVSEIKYYDYLNECYEEDEAEDRYLNVLEFKSILKTIEDNVFGNNRIELLKEAFDEAILSDSHFQSRKETDGGVTLSTIHSVKGLEFKYVFIIGLEENIFPKIKNYSKPNELEEERRICYVAMTRAKDKLYMLHAKKRLLYGTCFNNAPSRFINEAFGITKKQRNINIDEYQETYTQIEETKQIDKKIPFKIEGPSSTSYQISDDVVHDKYGPGIILSIKGDIGTIFFENEKCAKTILLTHQALRKVGSK